MRYQYRVTKYNPINRNDKGAYLKDEWTSFSDIGRLFSGSLLTESQYLDTEATYLFAIENFLREANIDSIDLCALQNYSDECLPSFIKPNAKLSIAQAVEFSRLALREIVWGKLVLPRRVYIHFGYDYYLYIGLPSKCAKTIAAVQNKGLFVETPIRSPYLRQRSKAVLI